MAMVIVSITMIGVTPLMFMVTASRVQLRRAEQAQQIAQAEIDRVRTTVERGVYAATDLPAVVTSALGTVAAASTVDSQIMKSTRPNCNSYDGRTLGSGTFLQVDTNGDCVSDFLLQSYRTAGTPGTTVPTSGFRMAVRVYVDNPTLRQNLSNLRTNPVALSFTSGLGGQISRPMTVVYSTIVRNDTGNSLQDYRAVCTAPGAC